MHCYQNDQAGQGRLCPWHGSIIRSSCLAKLGRYPTEEEVMGIHDIALKAFGKDGGMGDEVAYTNIVDSIIESVLRPIIKDPIGQMADECERELLNLNIKHELVRDIIRRIASIGGPQYRYLLGNNCAYLLRHMLGYGLGKKGWRSLTDDEQVELLRLLEMYKNIYAALGQVLRHHPGPTNFDAENLAREVLLYLKASN